MIGTWRGVARPFTVDAVNATDAELVTRLRAGEPAALAELYDRYADPLLALGYRMLGDRAEAEDVLLEAFEQAWREVDRFDPERGSVRVWLSIMVRSRSLDRIRASRRRERATADAARSGVEGVMTSASAGPADSSELDELRSHVMAALSALPAAQRETIELAYYGGLSQSEIATRLGVPLGTVKTRMRDGLQKLRTVLRPTYGEQRV